MGLTGLLLPLYRCMRITITASVDNEHESASPWHTINPYNVWLCAWSRIYAIAHQQLHRLLWEVEPRSNSVLWVATTEAAPNVRTIYGIIALLFDTYLYLSLKFRWSATRDLAHRRCGRNFTQNVISSRVSLSRTFREKVKKCCV